ncbi:MAG: NAD(P)H-binding protein [Rubrivivax sp.]|nr:NAD(P)H-binding protein [Rubrivivax sp.]
MTALLAGATGLIGRELAASWTGPGELHLLVRRPVPVAGAAPQLQRVHVVDYTALPALPAADEAYCCLGTTIKVAGSQAAFRAVDFDAVLAFARAARQAGVRRFAVVSALGASPRSATFYNRIKGEMEQALAELGFAGLVIVRPSLLAGDRSALGQPQRPAERLALALTAPLATLIPRAWRPIAAATVARAMRRSLADARPGVRVVESAELQEIGT